MKNVIVLVALGLTMFVIGLEAARRSPVCRPHTPEASTGLWFGGYDPGYFAGGYGAEQQP